MDSAWGRPAELPPGPRVYQHHQDGDGCPGGQPTFKPGGLCPTWHVLWRFGGAVEIGLCLRQINEGFTRNDVYILETIRLMAWNCSGSCFKFSSPNKRGSNMSDSSKADCHKKSVQVSQFFLSQQSQFLSQFQVFDASSRAFCGGDNEKRSCHKVTLLGNPRTKMEALMAFMGKASTNGEIFHRLWAGLHHFYWQWRSQKRTIRPPLPEAWENLGIDPIFFSKF